MHHGTLLYCADLSEMSGALNVNREKLVTKGIESVKSRVANISALYEKLSGVSPEEFLLDILRFAENEYGAPSRKPDRRRAKRNIVAARFKIRDMGMELRRVSLVRETK